MLAEAGELARKSLTVTEASADELAKATFLKAPPPCMALCRIPQYAPEEIAPEKDLVLCLDGIQDPGNLGTIVRLAGWFEPEGRGGGCLAIGGPGDHSLGRRLWMLSRRKKLAH